jgi:hypothetical protein
MQHLLLFESFSEILYHGTNRKFASFKLSDQISNPTYGAKMPDNGLGIFFTDNLTMAKWFAGIVDYDADTERYEDIGGYGRVIEARVNVKNPWVLSDHVDKVDDDDPGQTYFEVVEKMGGGAKMRETLQAQGYDGVVVDGMSTNYYEDGTYKMVVVFDPKSIVTLSR